ncbi:MAG: hypothetical protein DRN57_05150 [Thermoplasmata archaeon]|nr:MAG: hypothetical protein DRN57_05150 [Thermoplasmata archaeon]
MKHTLHLTVLLSLFLLATNAFPIANTGGNTPATAPDPEFDPEAGEDVPTWAVGDYWNFTTEVEYDLGLASMTLSGWMNITIEFFTLDLLGSGDPVYISNISGNISGEQVIPLIGEVRIYIELSGYTWNRAADLSVYMSVLNVSVSGNVPGINGDYPMGYEYSPPMEEYDFPLSDGDTWHINTSARIPFGGSGDLVQFEYNASCGRERNLTVPAGTFSVLPVSFDGSEVLFYNSSVGRSVERRYHIAQGSTGIDVPFRLSSYHRGARSVAVDLSVTTPQQVEGGSHFTVHGEVSSSNVIVNIFFPGGTLAYTKMLIFPNRDFDAELTAPMFPDSTPTLIDHGSFGIVAVVNTGDGLGVVTVTTKARDVEILPGDLEVLHEGNGTVDDTFRAHITVRNPSNFGVSNLSLRLIMDDGIDNITMIEMDNGYHIDGRSVLEIYQNLPIARPGNYSLIVIADPEDMISEYNETNNGDHTSFSVLPRPEIEWDVSPPSGNITLSEGENISLHAKALRDGVPLTGIWFLDGEQVSMDNDIDFNTTFDGANSSRGEPYRFIYDVSAVSNQTYPGDLATSVMFNITVLDVNRPLNLEHYSPPDHEPIVLENDTLEFMVDATDPDGDELTYTWTLGNVTWNGTERFTLHTEFIGNLSSSTSPILVAVVISDGRDDGFDISLNWSVTIVDVDRPFHASVVPEPGNITAAWNGTLRLEYNVLDPDNTPVFSLWELPNRTVENSTSLSINVSEVPLDEGGTFDVLLTLRSGVFARNFSWHVTVEGPPEVPEPEPYPPAGLRIISPAYGAIYQRGDVVLLSAAYDDDREIQLQWLVNGTWYLGNDIPIDDLAPGIHNIILKATAESGVPGEATLYVTITVRDAEHTGEGSDERDEGDTSTSWGPIILVLVIVIVILVFIVFLFFLLSRNRDEEEAEDWGEE